MGSILVARLAGKRHAERATKSSKATTEKNVSGSVVFTPKSMLFIMRVDPTAPINPARMPMNANPIPRCKTSERTVPRRAPRATANPVGCRSPAIAARV